MTRVVVTAAGYETTCLLTSIEQWLRIRYEPAGCGRYSHANLPPRWSLPWISSDGWRIRHALIGDSAELAQVRCAEGIEQCDYCACGQARRAWRAVMDSIPAGPCVYCGAPDGRTVDHVIPQAQNGPHHPANLVRACRVCNSSKGKLTPEQWASTGRAPGQWTVLARSSADVLAELDGVPDAA